MELSPIISIMFIKAPRSYISSDQALTFISNCGFKLLRPTNSEDDGTHRALLPLRDPSGAMIALEFCEILDEVLFASKEIYGRHFRHDGTPLQAHWIELDSQQITPLAHPNGVDRYVGACLLESLQDEPWAQYLRIRKSFSLAAVHLQCQNLETCRAFQNFDREYQIGSRKFGLLHLGPTSFDLLIEEHPGQNENI